MPPTPPRAVVVPPGFTSTVPGPVRRHQPYPDEQQALLDYSADLDHRNNGSVIERRWPRNMDVVCGQPQAVTAQLAVMATGSKHRAAPRAEADDQR